jgi:uncharacterized membrane protein
MRTFSFRPALSFKGRKFRGLRGWAGKPLHPPLTDVPVGAYTLAAAFDLISFIAGDGKSWSQDLYRAAGWALIGGAVVSVFATLTGFWDWLKSTEKGTQARRTVNAHAWTMIVVTSLVAANVWTRIGVAWDEPATPLGNLVFSLLAFVLVTIGGTIGGTLVFDYGFNVETAGDSPVWHPSETDVLPKDKGAAPVAPPT